MHFFLKKVFTGLARGPVRARYELRFTRLTNDNTSTRVRDDSFVSAIRTVQRQAPVRASGRCLVAMRIKATDQVNGVVNQFSAVTQARLPVWSGTEWVEQATRHPAWAYLDVLQGPANRRPVSDERLDLGAFKAWADATPDFSFDAVIDYPTTVFELLRDVAAAGRAGFGMRDGKCSVVRDEAQSVPIQHFTPRNTMGFRGRKTFTQVPHGLKCRFVNPDRDWQQDEVIVYADGYHEANASRFETPELFGCTSADLAWKHGRYHLAVGKLRPETYEISVDIDHLVCTAGDLVKVSHDVPLWGGGWGRVKEITYDANGDVIGITLDDMVQMVGGATAAFSTTRLAPISDRNVILQSDRKAQGWPGVRHDLEIETDDLLALARSGGVNAQTGAYYFTADLGQAFRARNWMSTGIVAIPSDPAIWSDASFNWGGELANVPWLPVGDADGASLRTIIAVDAVPGADLIEGFTLNGDLSGLKGAAASMSNGLSYADAHFAQGLKVLDTTQVAWPVTIPAEFTTTFDLRFDELLDEPQIFVTWSGGAGLLSLGYDPAASLYYLEDHLGNRVTLSLPRIAGDLVTFGVSQSALERSLFAASLKGGDVFPVSPTGTK